MKVKRNNFFSHFCTQKDFFIYPFGITLVRFNIVLLKSALFHTFVG
jgi:hypothetical protein